jgi:RNA polymerase sigma factor (TIGR02999 family)
MASSAHDATVLLGDIGRGDRSAVNKLLPLVYDELRALAGSYFRAQRADHTLQPTALVHKAFVRLIDQSHFAWNDRAHFFAVAATAMRQILADHARRVRAPCPPVHLFPATGPIRKPPGSFSRTPAVLLLN